jgi:hypothetical protein
MMRIWRLAAGAPGGSTRATSRFPPGAAAAAVVAGRPLPAGGWPGIRRAVSCVPHPGHGPRHVRRGRSFFPIGASSSILRLHCPQVAPTLTAFATIDNPGGRVPFNESESLLSGFMNGADVVPAPGSNTLARLASSSNRLAALEDERRAEKRRRDELIMEARDELSPWRAIAKAARCSIARCSAIVSGV